jgi:hypothetical protein
MEIAGGDFMEQEGFLFRFDCEQATSLTSSLITSVEIGSHFVETHFCFVGSGTTSISVLSGSLWLASCA